MNLKKLIIIGILIAIALYFLLVIILEAIQLAVLITLFFLVVYLLILNFRKKR